MKTCLCALLLAAAFAAHAETPTSPAPDASTRALEAMEKAAASAQRAAEAAQLAAEAAAKSAVAAEKAASTPAAALATTAAAGSAAKPADAPKLPDPSKTSTWTGLVGIGLIALTGNSEAVTFKGTAALERKTESWIYGVKASGVYGQSRATGAVDSEINALAAAIQARGDRRFTPTLSGFVLAGEETDHLKSIEHRPYGEGGFSLQWWDVKEGEFQKSAFRTDLGFRYGHEFRFQYYPTAGALPGVDIIAPHAGALLRYGISKEIIFTQDADLLANLVGAARLLLTTNTKLAARLTDAVSIGITFSVAYDSVPAPARKSTDTSLSVGIEVGL